MKNAKKMSKPIRISRKLKLSSEKVVTLTGDAHPADPSKCTHKRTGCGGPIHTC